MSFILTNSVFAQQSNFSFSNPLFVNAYSSNHADISSCFINHALLSGVKRSQIGFYGEQRFMMKENAGVYLMGVCKTGFGNFGVDAGMRGYSGFNQFQIGLDYAKELSNTIHAGIGFGYFSNRISEFESNSFFAASFSLNFHPLQQVNTGFQIEKSFNKKYYADDDEIPIACRFGFGYDVSKEFMIGMLVYKKMGIPVNISPGILYAFSKKMSFRFGYSGDTQSLCTGLDLTYKELALHLFFSHHPQLGISPGILMSSFFKNQTE